MTKVVISTASREFGEEAGNILVVFQAKVNLLQLIHIIKE